MVYIFENWLNKRYFEHELWSGLGEGDSFCVSLCSQYNKSSVLLLMQISKYSDTLIFNIF